MHFRAQDLCESQGGHPGLPVPKAVMILMVSMDISNIEEEDSCPVDFIINDFRNIVLLLMLLVRDD